VSTTAIVPNVAGTTRQPNGVKPNSLIPAAINHFASNGCSSEYAGPPPQIDAGFTNTHASWA
jgi:hypothetical protein